MLLIDLPPPVHGMSIVNASVKEAVIESKGNVRYLNTVPSSLKYLWGTKFWGVSKIFYTLYCLISLFIILLVAREKVVYRPINGGLGQIYDVAYLAVCRIFSVKIIIHHHSFQYLNRYSKLFSALNGVAGKSAVHVTLGPRMSELLMAKYAIDESQVLCVSNIAFFNQQQDECVPEGEVLRLGHLANLCIEKGLGHFADVCKVLSLRGVTYEAIIAGPFSDEESSRLVSRLIKEFPNVKYIGPVYGDAKNSFFSSLDAFVFPSGYVNEAEPMVLYEAAQYGALTIGTQRGCMKGVIESLGGVSFEENVDIASDIASYLTEVDLVELRSTRADRLNLFHLAQNSACHNLSILVEQLGGKNVSEPSRV